MPYAFGSETLPAQDQLKNRSSLFPRVVVLGLLGS